MCLVAIFLLLVFSQLVLHIFRFIIIFPSIHCHFNLLWMSHVPHLCFFIMSKTNNILSIVFAIIRLIVMLGYVPCAQIANMKMFCCFYAFAIYWVNPSKSSESNRDYLTNNYIYLKYLWYCGYSVWISRLHHVHSISQKVARVNCNLAISQSSLTSFLDAKYIKWLKSKRTDRMLCMKYIRKIELNLVAKLKLFQYF